MLKLSPSIIINGEPYMLKAFFTVSSLLEYLGFNSNLIVVDYNGTILQKELWVQTQLNSNDTIEILTIAGGG